MATFMPFPTLFKSKRSVTHSAGIRSIVRVAAQMPLHKTGTLETLATDRAEVNLASGPRAMHELHVVIITGL